MKTLRELKKNIQEAEIRMKTKLSQRWPVNSHVLVMLHCRQVIPTHGTVIGHHGDGYIVVRIDSAKKDSRRSARSIYFTHMMS